MPNWKPSVVARKARSFLSLVRRRELANELRIRAGQRKVRRLRHKWEVLKAQGIPVKYDLGRQVKIRLYPDDKLSQAIYTGEFELDEQALVRDFLRPGDVFVDIGANIGLFVVTAANIVGGGRVFAFEPTAQTYGRLVDNVELNGFENVSCFQMALSDKEEERVLTVSRDGYAAWNSLAQPTEGEVFGQEKVACGKWDDFAAKNELLGAVTLMKIDVEGWELYVLNGAAKTLARSDAPDILIEFTEANAISAGTSCSAVYECLQDLGYRLYVFDAAQRCLRFDPLREHYPYLNLLATKRIDSVAGRLGYGVQVDSTGPH